MLGFFLFLGGIFLADNGAYALWGWGIGIEYGDTSSPTGALILGVILILLGSAIATQRYQLVLDRAKGVWSRGGDVFFVIKFHDRGRISELGPVRITRLEKQSFAEKGKRQATFIYFPVRVNARKIGGGETELNFGQWGSREEAGEAAASLAEFLNRPVQDDSDKKE
ncbi:MAG: hypothetical protein ACE5EN_05600 [Nitrospinota bacterium]